MLYCNDYDSVTYIDDRIMKTLRNIITSTLAIMIVFVIVLIVYILKPIGWLMRKR